MSDALKDELIELLSTEGVSHPDLVRDIRTALESLGVESYVPLADNWHSPWHSYLPSWIRDNWDRLPTSCRLVAFMCCKKMADMMDVDPRED